MSRRTSVYAVRSAAAWQALVAQCDALAAETGWPAAVWWRRGTGAVRLVCGEGATSPAAGWHLGWQAGTPDGLAGAAWQTYCMRAGEVGEPVATGGGAEMDPYSGPEPYPDAGGDAEVV